MTATQIIEEIKRLPMEERTKVIEFARKASGDSRLSPEELGVLAKRLAAADPKEAASIRERLTRGFYGI